MGNTYTTDDLINDILLLGHIPTGNNTFTDSKILQLANFELQLPITKQILSTRGGYYLTYSDYDPVSSGLYVIPSDAIGGMLANVELVDSTAIIPVNIIEESEQLSTISPTSTSFGAFMRGNYVQILPTPNQPGVVRLWFYKRTSKLVGTADAAQITVINGSTYTVSSLPSTMLVGTDVDVCGDQPPFNILGDDVEITNINSTDVTLSSAPADVSVGDWIALHNQTPVPQIPVEYRLLLAQRVVCKMYELQGYLEKLAAAAKILEKYESDTFGLITPRIKSQTKVITTATGGFLRGNPNRLTNFPAGPLPP